jgi:two-component system, NarL family, response regulator
MSERELAIMRSIANGLGNREIGDQLGLSEQRVKQQISAILERFGANDRAHAVAIAMGQGLI